MRILTALLIAFSIAFPTKGQSTNNLPKEVNLVFEYIINKDYPEVFGGNPYKIRPVNWVITDIDNDGTTEVFLQTFPHFRQSPTIIIYQIDGQDSVKRIAEALAPGHLIELWWLFHSSRARQKSSKQMNSSINLFASAVELYLH